MQVDRNRRRAPVPAPTQAVRPYSLLVVLNESYRKFGTIFLNSLYRNANLSLIQRIYVGDVGLSAESRRFFQSYDKVEIIDTKVNTDFIGIHADDWLRSVAVKSKLLLNLVQREQLPICMIDADCVVVRDFSHVLDESVDIQICQRNRRVRRRDGLVMKYIGSFLVVNSRRAVGFLEEWIREIEHLYRIKAIPAHETPALCRTVERYRNEVRLGVLPEAAVSCDRACEEGTLVIHMKSNAAGAASAEESFQKRVHAVRNYSGNKILTYL